MIYVVADLGTDLTSFIFEGIQRNDVRLVHYPATVKGMGSKICRWLDACFPVVPLNIYPRPDFAALTNGISEQDVVVLFSIMNPKDLQLLKKHFKRNRICLFLWNPIIEVNGDKVRAIRRLNTIQAVSDCVMTFDAQDAQKYGFSLLPQPFRHVVSQEESGETMDHDFCFIGMDKGRLPFLMRFKRLAEQVGFRCFFHITPDKGVDYRAEERVFLSNDYLSYSQNLSYVARSRCLLEVTQRNQLGATMRSVEALFFNKKIITSRLSACEESGFDDRRVLILREGGDSDVYLDMQSVCDFMAKPLGSPDTQAMQVHEINQWLNNFTSPPVNIGGA